MKSVFHSLICISFIFSSQNFAREADSSGILQIFILFLGAIISELLHNWAVKSQKFGFSLMPVPSDPFALPITLNSDPVRGPIFIELDTDCLLDDTNLSNIFEKFPEKSREQRLFLFREEIAHR